MMRAYDTNLVYENVTIEDDVSIGAGAIIYPGVTLGAGTTVMPYAIIGEPSVERMREYSNNPYCKATQTTTIGKNSIIRSFVNISEGVEIGDNCHVGDRVLIRPNTKIGNNVSIGNLCDLQGDISIGDYTRLHSNVFLAEFTTLGKFVWIFPHVVFTNDPYPPHGESIGSTVKDYSLVAVHATVMPGVTIGENSLVGAHSLVLKDIGEDELWCGVPAKLKRKLSEIKDKSGRSIYPWKNFLKKNRGYPWQK